MLFFVRRDSRNALYRRVLERYVNLATRAGVCQAVFLEGGLTRDGRLRDPKQGFLDYMMRDYHVDIDRDVVFVPVGINYDRVIEDVSLVRRLDPEATRRSLWFVIKTSLKFTVKTLSMSRRKRWLRFGYASVNFGKPVSAREFFQQREVDPAQLEPKVRFRHVEDLSHLLMQEIADVVPILPVALVSEVLVGQTGEWLSEVELKAHAVARIEALKRDGAPIRIAPGVYEGVLTATLTMLEGRGFVENKEGLLRARPESIDILSYYANSIQQWQTN